MENKKKFHLPVSGKIRRRFVRVVAVIIGLYVLLLISISIYVSSSKEKLLAFVKEKMSETILGELKIDKADISVWQTFPNIGITLSNVVLSDSFYRRPFLKAGAISAKIRFIDLIGKKIKIHSLKVEDAKIFAFTDKNGYTNSYVLKSQNTQKRKSKKPVLFNNIELENVTLISEDAIKIKRYAIRINEAEADISFRGSTYYVTLDEDILVRGLGFNLFKGYWLDNQRVQAKWKLQFDTSNHILSFNKTKVEIEDHPFIIKGSFFLSAPSHFRLEVSTEDIAYNAAMAILKPTTSSKIRAINLTGPISVKAVLDGPMAYRTTPSIKADFTTARNNMHTPVADFNDCNFSGSYINQFNGSLPPSDSNSKVAIDTFTSKWGDIQINTKDIAVSNLVKPLIQFELSSACTLQQLDEQLNSTTLQFTDGNANIHLAYNGPMIADPSLLNRVDAKIQIENGNVIYLPRSLNFSRCNGLVSITGNNLMVDNLRCTLNTNQFVVNIAGHNLNRLSVNEAGNATISCNVYSPSVDLSNFKTLFAQKKKAISRKKKDGLAGTANAVDNALENGDLYVNLNAGQLSLDHFKATNVAANIFFKNNDWEVKQATLQHADGNFKLTAKVHEINNAMHQLSTQVNLQHINIEKLFYGFNNFGQTGITYKNIKGILNSKANLTTTINSSGKIIMSSLHGTINFSLANAALINMQSLKNIQNYIFKKRNLDYVEFADITNTFTLKGSDIYIPKMPIQSSAITMYISGVYSFEDRTDIAIQVPFSSLTNKPHDDFKVIDSAKTARPGASIYLRAKDKDGQVKIGLDVCGKMRKDKKKKKH